MDNTDIKSLSQIIQNLHNFEYISPKSLQQLNFLNNNQISCYVGLTNLLYNLIREGVKKNQSSFPPQRNTLFKQESINLQKEQFKGNILKIRGQIIRQYGKLLINVLPQPAYSLAKFNFSDFNAFCIRRDLGYLLRHTRGIYPSIDIKKTPLLRFLPFYDQLKDEQSLIVGNQNWKLSRTIMNKFYQQQVKTQKIFGNQMEIQNDSKQIDDDSLRNGIKLSYILLTQKHQQMLEYIRIYENQVQQIVDQNIKIISKQCVKRWKFWYQNYCKFIEQGLKTYEQKQNKNNQPLVYNLKVDNIQQSIISLIQKIIKLNAQNQSEKRTVMLNQISQNINKLVQFITQIQLINQQPLLQDQINFQNAQKMLLLSFLHAIHKFLFKNLSLKDPSNKAYKELNQTIPVQQIFNSIFYNSDEILQLYSTKKIKIFPTLYHYGPQLMPKILKLIVQNNPGSIVNNLKIFNIMQPTQQLSFLINSRLIGNIDNKFDKNQISPGEHILTFLQHNKQKLKQKKQQPMFSLIKKNDQSTQLDSFIKQGRQFYSFIRKFNKELLVMFMSKYANIKTQSQLQKVKIFQQKNQAIKIKSLLNRPNVIYHICNAFLKQIEKQKDICTRLIQEENNIIGYKQNLKLTKNKLSEYLKIFQQQNFKTMLNDSDSQFILGEKVNIQDSQSKKQKFQDKASKIYFEAFLLLEQYCKSIFEQKKSSSQIDEENDYYQGEDQYYNEQDMDNRMDEEVQQISD